LNSAWLRDERGGLLLVFGDAGEGAGALVVREPGEQRVSG
jgi:hypothetical protein